MSLLLCWPSGTNTASVCHWQDICLHRRTDLYNRKVIAFVFEELDFKFCIESSIENRIEFCKGLEASGAKDLNRHALLLLLLLGLWRCFLLDVNGELDVKLTMWGQTVLDDGLGPCSVLVVLALRAWLRVPCDLLSLGMLASVAFRRLLGFCWSRFMCPAGCTYVLLGSASSSPWLTQRHVPYVCMWREERRN